MMSFRTLCQLISFSRTAASRTAASLIRCQHHKHTHHSCTQNIAALNASIPKLLHVNPCRQQLVTIPTRHYCKTSESEKATTDKNEVRNETNEEPKENIYTIPNALTVGRFIAAPFLGYMVLQENFTAACGLLALAALTDMADGYIARHWEGQASIIGSVIDPLADKFLVFNLVISLTAVQLIPLWLTGIYLARDVYLVLNGFKVRYVTLPPPKTFKRYWDFSHPTAVVTPSMISKVNTNLQLLLLTATCAAPVFGYVDHVLLQSLWYITGVTTSWSFISYLKNPPVSPIDQSINKKDRDGETGDKD